nr:hypothetical protein [Tanacetum cinerariifolium]
MGSFVAETTGVLSESIKKKVLCIKEVFLSKVLQMALIPLDMDHAAKVLSMQEDEPEIQEAVEVVTTAKLMTEVVAAVSETVNAAAVVPTVTAVVVPTVTAAPVKAKENPYVQREDLESLWNIVKERFSTSNPNNFLDDFLLTTLRVMFGRPDGQDQVWMTQRSVHGQAKVKSWKLLESYGVHIIALTTTQLIMLVERRYPVSSAAEKNNAAKSRKDC